MPEIVMYGTAWCGDCVRSKRFLDERQLLYTYHDIQSQPELADLVIALNEQAGHGPKRRIPVILVDGRILSEPTDAELAEALGLAY
jgi:glutaredoxin